jgi:hypothetical protein
MLDFIAWPAFREFAVQVPRMQERMDWMMDMSLTIQCDWSFANDEAFRRDDETGLLDLCLVAKVCSLRYIKTPRKNHAVKGSGTHAMNPC